MKRIVRSAIVGYSAEKFRALVEDIAAYPRFLPWCSAAAVTERDGGRTVATLTLGARGVRRAITTENFSRDERLEIHMLQGPFRRFDAVWRFRPLAKDAAKVEFSLQYDFASRGADRLLEPLLERIADTIVDAFERRAASLYGADAR